MIAVSERIQYRGAGGREKSFRRRLAHFNWPLYIGGAIVLLVVLLAVIGPEVAPNNPMEEHYTLRVNGRIMTPPYPPLSVQGYPLGTDRFGRDLFSRILWGVRPTLIMVTTVAAVRLLFGLIIGLLAGWSTGRFGRFLEVILSWALAIPVLLVALVGITALGIEKGLWAFIISLALNGWAETARFVSNQTRTIKSQIYVEAAQALGATEFRILVFHIFRQILPLLWMLLAFEVSSTFLVSAELGFLGYYIGGGIWVEVSDFASVNTTGLPELGQMLSTALVKLTDPAGLIVVGSVLFLAILGFNLLGEGLRLGLNPERSRNRRRIRILNEQIVYWVDEKLTVNFFGWLENHLQQLGIVVLLGLGAYFGWHWMDERSAPEPVVATQTISVPGGHLWATARHDAQGTFWTHIAGPANPQVEWTYVASGGLTGGPAVNAEGIIYLGARDSLLIALDTDGKEIWRAPVEENPVGAPALGIDGTIYVTDEGGGLSAYNDEGQRQWRLSSQIGRTASSGPIVGADGTIYFTVVDSIQAVSKDGELLWVDQVEDSYIDFPPQLSAQDTFIFLKDSALAAANGAEQNLSQYFPVQTEVFQEPEFVVGADGKLYYRIGHEIFPWKSTEAGVQVDASTTWDYRAVVATFPILTGISPDRQVWMFYATSFMDTRLVWLSLNDNLLSNVHLPERDSRLIGFDINATAYFCASNFGFNLKCSALERGKDSPRWVLELDEGLPVGGAIVPGRVYLATDWGGLFALGDVQP